MTEHIAGSVRWGIVGFGVGGRVFHAPLIAAASEIDLRVIVGSDRHDGAARALGADRVRSLQEAVDVGIDAVTITTPAGTHAALAHEALDLGLHVVVDKPFAINRAEADELVSHADAVGRRLSVYQNRRWDGDFLTLRTALNDGLVGTPFRFENRIQRFWPVLPAWNISASATDGGGTLVDLGPHLIDQAVQLFGPARRVTAHLRRVGGGSGAENDVRLILTHDEDRESLIEASIATAAVAPRMQLNGTDGGILIDGFDVQEGDLLAGRTPSMLGHRWGIEPSGRVGLLTTREGSRALPLHHGHWTFYYPSMSAAIRTGSAVPVDAKDAAHTAAVFDAARTSAAEHRTVPIS